MKAATVNEIKKELSDLDPKTLVELCMSLAKYKKDNKELLTYLLFESHNQPAFIAAIKNKMDEQFPEINHSNLYLAKKSLRKILRITNKYIKHMGSKPAEAELLIYYCNKLKHSGIPIHKSALITNLYNHQLKKINVVIAKLHEDLQYDFKKDLEDHNN